MDDIGDYAPEREIAELGEIDRLVAVVLRNQESRRKVLMIAPYEQFAVEDGHDDFSVAEFDRAVDDEHVAIEDAGFAHGIAFHSEEIGGGLVADELLVEVDAALGVIIGRCSESGGVGGLHLMLREILGAAVGGVGVEIPIHIAFWCKLMFLVFNY